MLRNRKYFTLKKMDKNSINHKYLLKNLGSIGDQRFTTKVELN